MRVKREIEVLEIDGEKINDIPHPIFLEISYNKDRIILDVGDRTITVRASELERAVKSLRDYFF